MTQEAYETYVTLEDELFETRNRKDLTASDRDAIENPILDKMRVLWDEMTPEDQDRLVVELDRKRGRA